MYLCTILRNVYTMTRYFTLQAFCERMFIHSFFWMNLSLDDTGLSIAAEISTQNVRTTYNGKTCTISKKEHKQSLAYIIIVNNLKVYKEEKYLYNIYLYLRPHQPDYSFPFE